MKPAIKKLRTCVYSTDLVAASFFGQADQHTNKLVCDHPEMKIGWSEKVCGDCKAYVNRNASLLRPAPAPQPHVQLQSEPVTRPPASQPAEVTEPRQTLQPATAVEQPRAAEVATPAPSPAPLPPPAKATSAKRPSVQKTKPTAPPKAKTTTAARTQAGSKAKGTPKQTASKAKRK